MVIKRVMRANTKQARLLGEQLGPPLPPSAQPEPCPLCGRPLIAGPSVDEHHLRPRSQGGKEKYLVHKICHRKIHQSLSEKELARNYATWQSLRAHPEIALFIQWAQRRPADYMD